MPLLYETTAETLTDGVIDLHLENLPFKKGTRFTIKLIPESAPTADEMYLFQLNELRRLFQEESPFKNMSKDEIVTELRRQREAMYDE